MMKNTKQFFDLIRDSIQSGKINVEKKCPFCGSELDSDRLEGMDIRIGRLIYLLREHEKGSTTAYNTLESCLLLKKIYDGKDIPEDTPEWWKEIVSKIRQENKDV